MKSFVLLVLSVVFFSGSFIALRTFAAGAPWFIDWLLIFLIAAVFTFFLEKGKRWHAIAFYCASSVLMAIAAISVSTYFLGSAL
jgi:hypothetical protein